MHILIQQATSCGKEICMIGFKKIMPLALLFLLISLPALALPAFPGAQGMGASTIGGRGGTIYKVTNLNDTGAGSFRAAVTASGPRIVIFEVSGVINLQSLLTITNPYLTIAGQTSPGGICIAGWTVQFNTHDVIATHMRFRTGQLGQGASNPDDVHAIQVFGSSQGTGVAPAYNIIFDHCSFSWGIDENIDIDYDYHDITFSWCSIIDPLMGNHSEGAHHNLGMLAWGKYTAANSGGMTMHHCFFGYNYYRVPEVNFRGFLDLTNNVNYWTYSSWAPMVEPMTYNNTYEKCYANIKYCYNDVRGSASEIDPSTRRLARSAIIATSGGSAYPAIYMIGCLSGTRTSQSASEWDVGDYSQTWGRTLASTSWQSTTEFAVTGIPVTATTIDSSYAATIVTGAGASKPCFASVDIAAQTNYNNGTGAFKSATGMSYPSSWPTFNNTPTPTDSDNDGMSDAWEMSTFGSLSQTAHGDYNGNGYENIEEYLHYLGGYSSAQTLLDTSPPEAPAGVGIIIIQ